MTSSQTPARISDDPLENAGLWFQANSKPIGIAVTAVVIVGALVFGYRSMDASKREKASTALYEARAPMSEGNLAAADAALNKVVERYGGTASGQQAVLLLAQVRYDQGKFDEGIRLLDSKVGSASSEFSASMYGMIAMGYEGKNDPVKAAEAYGKAAAAARFETNRGEYKASQARSLMMAGKTEEARKLWQELADNEALRFSDEARVRLGELSGVAK